jgi:hypothetical protein
VIRAVYDDYAVLLVQQRTKNDIGAVAHRTMCASERRGASLQLILWAFDMGLYSGVAG